MPSASRAFAQTCSRTDSRLALSDLSGRAIRSVRVVTVGPTTLPSPAGRLGSFRGSTLASTVRRQLLFAPGDTVDTLRVAETLRRLREENIFSDVAITAQRCSYGDDASGGDSVDVTVRTRDAWTLLPVGQLTPPSTVALGVEDRDFLGTGRAVSVSTMRRGNRQGGSVAFADPWVLGTRMMAGIRASRIGDIHQFRASVATHLTTIFDPWSAEAVVGVQSQRTSTTGARLTRTLFGSALAAPAVRTTESGVTRLLVGVEIDSAAVVRDTAPALSASDVRLRRYVGADFGVRHVTAVFDTVGWFAPGRGFLDIPTGVQGEGILGLGQEQTVRAAAAHYDLWTGRTWLPTRRSLISADVWTSGYVGHAVRANHIDRVAVMGYHAAGNGFWGARVLVEQLLELDPDLRMLSLLTTVGDPTFPAVPSAFRFSDRALSGTVERSIHLRSVGRASVVDGALFAAASERWDAPRGAGRLTLGVAGVRFRLLSANGVVRSTRVDIGWPVASSKPVRRGPVVSVSVAPLFELARLRDGRRRQR